MKALGELRNPEAVPALIAVVQGDDEWLAITAVEALGKIRDNRAVPALGAALHSHEALQRIAEQRGVNGPSALAAAQYSQDIDDLRIAAARALGQIASDEALKALADVLTDDKARWLQPIVAGILEQVGSEKVRGIIQAWKLRAAD